jgi:GNAT superfamily N-acetyltransferase
MRVGAPTEQFKHPSRSIGRIAYAVLMGLSMCSVDLSAASPWRADRANVAALLTLKREVVEATFGLWYPHAPLADWVKRFVSTEYFADRIDSDTAPTTFYALGSPRRPAGMIALKERGGTAYVGDLYVRFRGEGIGRRLLRYALAESHRRGYERVFADGFASNVPAVRLLAEEGFEQQAAYWEQSLEIEVCRFQRVLR